MKKTLGTVFRLSTNMTSKPLTLIFALILLSIVWTTGRIAIAVEFAFEAELGKIQAPIKAEKDKDASNGQYVRIPPGVGNFVGWIDYEIEIPKATKYYIWGRVIATDGGNDSYMVTWDGEERGDNNGVNVWDTQQSQVWSWDAVNGRGHSDPKAFKLSKGKHTLRMWGREDDTKLDCLFISDKSNAAPRFPTDKELAHQKKGGVIGGKLAVTSVGKLPSVWGNIKMGY